MELPETTKGISVEWLNEVLHENGFLGDSNITLVVPDKVGVGQGNNSDIAKLALNFDQNGKNLPKTIVAKLPPSDETVRKRLIAARVFEREIRFYREVAPRISIRTPKLIYGAVDTDKERATILMEDCSYATPAEPELEGLNYEETKIAVSKIADFHAQWWKAETLAALSWVPNMKEAGIRNAKVGNTMRLEWDACNKREDFRSKLPDGGWEAGAKIIEQLDWLVNSLPEDKLSLIHGDFRSDNIFFDWDTPNDPLIVIDWGATTVIARGAMDLSFLLGCSITPEMRRKVEKSMVRLYYDRLIEKGVHDYTFNECWTDYIKGLLLKTRIPLNQFGLRDHSSPRGTKLVNTTLQRWFLAVVENDATSILP